MTVIFIISIYLIVYGIAGLFGFQIIPAKYKGHTWTKAYIRSRGATSLLLGVLWLAFNRVVAFASLDIEIWLSCVILLALGIPSLVISIFIDKKYRAMLSR